MSRDDGVSTITHPETPAPPDAQIEDWPAYNDRKSLMQLKWKPRILQRDGYACRWCHKSQQEEQLELAHVTDCKDFYLVRHRLEDLDLSYSEDNLVILCHTCHKAQTGTLRSLFNSELNRLFQIRNRLKDDEDVKAYFVLAQNPKVREFVDVAARIDPLLEDMQKRAHALAKDVQGFMDGVKEERGWKHADERILVPAELQPTPVADLRTWLLYGFIPVRVCQWPGANFTALGRMKEGACVDCDTTLDGVGGCLQCHVLYCERHRNHGVMV